MVVVVVVEEWVRLNKTGRQEPRMILGDKHHANISRSFSIDVWSCGGVSPQMVEVTESFRLRVFLRQKLVFYLLFWLNVPITCMIVVFTLASYIFVQSEFNDT